MPSDRQTAIAKTPCCCKCRGANLLISRPRSRPTRTCHARSVSLPLHDLIDVRRSLGPALEQYGVRLPVIRADILAKRLPTPSLPLRETSSRSRRLDKRDFFFPLFFGVGPFNKKLPQKDRCRSGSPSAARLIRLGNWLCGPVTTCSPSRCQHVRTDCRQPSGTASPSWSFLPSNSRSASVP